MGTVQRRIKKGYKLVRRTLKRLTKRKNIKLARRYVATAAIGLLLVAGFVATMDTRNVNYDNLLDTIAKGESRGNYNAYYGNARNTSVDFTSMTVGEVLDWQKSYVEQGSRSSAVGKYQFIRPTLEGLVNEMNIDRTERFTPALQDRLAIRLLERRGLNDYVDGKITREQLAHNLSKEWAALPRVIGGDPSASYYEGDGLNKVQVSIDEVFVAIGTLTNPS